MAGKALAIRLLGPVDARLGEAPVPLGPPQHRLFLSILALRPGITVPVERLLDLLWPGSAPRTARAAIQVAACRLQETLSEHAAIVGDGSGYRLELTDAWTDVATFQRLTRQARDSADPVAARLLAEADALWRGPALADVGEPGVREVLCRGLQESRLIATEERFDALLRLGRDDAALDQLTAAVAAHPLRQRLVGQLMVALHRTGRSAEALDLYAQTAGALQRERGVPPGSRLEELNELIGADAPQLRASVVHPEPDARPSALPATGCDLLGRDGELAALDTAAQRSPVAVLTGPGGAGKTALALHWAGRHRDSYPDGQLYVDLRGYSPGPSRRPVDVLAGFLRALGMGSRRIPSDPDEAAAAFRSGVRGRRVLIVLDNAPGADRAGTALLDPLLPADAGCFVLLTSRDPLEGLVRREGATRIRVPPLPFATARGLSGPAATDALARRCACLPLALTLAAAAGRQDPAAVRAWAVDGAADPIRHEPPDQPAPAPEPQPDSAAGAAIDLAYGLLPAREQRAFRLLGLVPGADVSVEAVAALTRLTEPEAAAVLRRLAGLALVTRLDARRYALHDLIAARAAELAEADGEAGQARTRLAEWYEATTASATGLLYPQHRMTLPGSMPVEQGRFADHGEAVRWLEREFGNLVALISASARHGPRAASWRLAAALSPYLRTDIPAAPIRLIAAAAASAAQVAEDLPGQAVANMTLASAAKLDNQHDVTERHLRRARRLALRAGWLSGEATALRLLGNLYGNEQRIRAAVRCCEESLGVFEQLGDLGGQAINLHNSGMMYFLLGDLAHARERGEQALSRYESIGSLTGAAKALAALAQVELRQGGPRRALERAGEARELAERSGDLRALEAALVVLAEVQHVRGEYDAAERALHAARTTGTNNPYTAIIAGDLTVAIACARGDFARALAEADGALAAATRLGAASFADQLHLRRASCLHGLGKLDTGLAAVQEAIELATRHEFGILHARGLVRLGRIRLARDEPDQADAAVRSALGLTRQFGDRFGEAHAHDALAAVSERIGEPDAARRHRARAAEAFTAMGVPQEIVR